MSNTDYIDPGPFTGATPAPQPVHPAVAREHKAQLRQEAAQARDSDREHLASLGPDELAELADAEGLPTTGSADALRARLLGEPEPSGPRFAP